jgi:D-3-phosphoglycerate dehydrogenase
VKPRILVTVPIEHLDATRAVLEGVGGVVYLKYPPVEELKAALKGVHALYPNARTRLDAAVLSAAADLRVISTPSIGTDHIDLEHCRARGIAVFSLATERELMQGVHSTAEHAFALLLALVKRVPWGFSSVLDGKWSAAEFRGCDLQGKTLGIVGFGVIGSQVAVFARAFAMEVLVFDPYAKALPPWARVVGRDELLNRSHVVTLHTPLTPETDGMVGREWFSRMKGTILVNASRGGVLDEAALLEALEDGRVSAFAADVLRGETAAGMGEHPLVRRARTHGNVLITPHTAGSSLDGQAVTFAHAARRITEFFKEAPIP